MNPSRVCSRCEPQLLEDLVSAGAGLHPPALAQATRLKLLRAGQRTAPLQAPMESSINHCTTNAHSPNSAPPQELRLIIEPSPIGRIVRSHRVRPQPAAQSP